ncbi:hypothetical protein [Breoghania sp. L-A4]|uniref:hypothetical protein n=1 Tax=Breoghania sp. L-A4 TaxID=2304600 RepID=UPI000E35E429|nr:hypothetical protein [Breoghania sp. L-A4]AXS40439.1 hypothetical protein D1F64_10680 [Breoghania sp. L-A4]
MLGFYSLIGMEQANRMAYDGKRPPDYRYHVEQILKQLETVSDEARDKAIDRLRGFLAEVGADDAVPAGTPVRRKAYGGPKKTRQRWPKSYVTPSKICIDLGGLGLGDVANATLALDHLLGTRASVEEAGSWPAIIARSARFIVQGMIGVRPAFHEPRPIAGNAAAKAS